MPQRPGRLPPPIPAEARRPRRVPPASHLPPPVPPEARSVRSPAAIALAPDDELVAAARKGERRSFAELVRRYRPRILALALQMTASRPDAEDIAQESFLQALEGLGAFEGRCAFFTWLYRIALNLIMAARVQRRRVTVDVNDPRVSLAVAVDSLNNPQRAMELRETYAQLVGAFDRLSPLLRTTVALTTLQGLNFAEAAEVMGTTEGTIAWRMHEARDQLRRTLQGGAVLLDAPVATPSRQRVMACETSGDNLALALTLACV